jgi:hypothetical protein
MVFLSRNTTVAGRRRYFWIFDLQLHLPRRDRNDEAQMTKECTNDKDLNHISMLATLPSFELRHFLLLRFQCDVAAAALPIDAQQNFFVGLQFFADGDEILGVLDRLLIHFLDHVPLAQTSFASWRVGINFRDHGTLNVLWKIQRRANVVGDISYRDSTENSSFLRLRAFFGRRFGTFTAEFCWRPLP